MKIKLCVLYILVLTLFTGCNVGKDLTGAYNMTQCKYDYKSISNLTISDMNLSKGISVLNIPKITSILSGKATSIPLNFTLNLDVNNPNQSAALLHGLQYVVNVDDIELTTGVVNQALNIPAGGNQMLPITIGTDLGELMQKHSKKSIENIAKNFLGLSDQKSKVTVQLKPTFMIGGRAITSPHYIPVSFEFGGK